MRGRETVIRLPVNPARAGMIRQVVIHDARRPGKPRASGDDPWTDDGRVTLTG